MRKRSIRDWWGKRTESKGLNPEMRTMQLSLDDVYEPRSTSDPGRAADTQRPPVTTKT